MPVCPMPLLLQAPLCDGRACVVECFSRGDQRAGGLGEWRPRSMDAVFRRQPATAAGSEERVAPPVG
ncbi:unnamed protein product [Lampetra fluviatilis]